MADLVSRATDAAESAVASIVPAAAAESSRGDEAAGKLQLVDEHQAFAPNLDKSIANWGLEDAGFAYNVCAVFGSQSTGKSTLLNRLFGTEFATMSESERKQTTRGIWMSKAAKEQVLVMDVEGTDGRERGEDQDFERKSALFSMAVSEVLIVNIWEHQVGLYQGANMGLLKTVFEVNLGLFLAAGAKAQSRTRTLLLFVIRDHVGTPLANLSTTLAMDLGRLWDSLAKPPGLEESRITDFFDLDFVALPHKVLQPDAFDAAALQLSKRFVRGGGAGTVWKDVYHKRIPADGLPAYLGAVWDAVKANKDLDLPTQQELLAQFRCDELAALAFAAFEATAKAWPAAKAGEPTVGLGARMGEAVSVALVAFDGSAARYVKSVYERKRSELLSKLHATLAPSFAAQLKNLAKASLRSYRKALAEEMKGEGYDFAAVVKAKKEEAEKAFEEGAKEAQLEGSGWTWEDEKVQLKEDLAAVADLLRKEEVKKVLAVVERNIKKQVAETVELSLTQPTPDMWDRILVAFSAALAKGETAYKAKAASFACAAEETEDALAALRKRSWLALRGKIDEQTAESVMLVKLKLIFEDKFRYDKDGVPRVWKKDDDIERIFKDAKDQTLALIPLYAKIEPVDPANEFSLPSSLDPTDLESPEFDFLSTLQVYSETKSAELANRFRREADAYYVEAKRSMVSSISQIPLWLYGVLVVLGWNEFVAIIRNPIYFTFILLAGATTYVLFQLNMLAPAIAVGRTLSREAVKAVNEQLHAHFNAPQLIPVPAAPVSAGGGAAEREANGEDFELKDRVASKKDD